MFPLALHHRPSSEMQIFFPSLDRTGDTVFQAANPCRLGWLALLEKLHNRNHLPSMLRRLEPRGWPRTGCQKPMRASYALRRETCALATPNAL